MDGRFWTPPEQQQKLPKQFDRLETENNTDGNCCGDGNTGSLEIHRNYAYVCDDDAANPIMRNTLNEKKTGGEWMWSQDTKPASGLVHVFTTVAFKCQVLLRSLMAFVLMSTVTAMTVRTLLSSGVVIMFPMVMLMERMGLQGVDMHVRGSWRGGFGAT